MPKIRGIKPELWTDENFVELSPYARLLWIGLWNHACDNGHLQDKSKQIKMRVLPTDDVNCAELLREIEGQGLIERADGWITIPNLSHHQKPHKRWWATCDKPGCKLPDGTSHTPSNRGTTVAPPKRNRGTTADVDGDVESDGDGESDKNTPAPRLEPDPTAAEFADFWSHYPRKVAKPKALSAYRAARKKATAYEIAAGLREHLPSMLASEPRYRPHPATWLNGERWTDEPPPAATAPPTRVQSHLQLARDLAAEQATILEIGERR